MEFGLTRVNLVEGGRASAAHAIGRAAEDLGFDSVWATEHIVWPEVMTSGYPYSPGGALAPGTTTSPFPEPLIWLSFVAGATSSLRLATGILVVPQREPILLAKQLATLDHLSEGRVMLGVGIGWLREEFELLGAPWRDRGRRTDDYIGAMRSLWTTLPTSVELPTVSFDGALMLPKPWRPDGVPIVISGGEAGAARAGRIGDGYYAPPSTTVEELRSLLEIMRRAADAAGRDADRIEVSVLSDPEPSAIEALSALGVHRVLISALNSKQSEHDVRHTSAERTIDDMAHTADLLFPQFR